MPAQETLLTAEALNPLWLNEWTTFSKAPTHGLKDWIKEKKFQIYSSQAQDKFSLDYLPNHSPLIALGYDSNRFLSASLETISQITNHPDLPKSAGWLIVKSYYAAFFAAHSLLRIFGRSCSHLETLEVQSINEIASLFQPSWTRINTGSYSISLHGVASKLNFEYFSKRPHELLWHIFKITLEEWLTYLSRPGSSAKYQPVILQLQSLCSNLTYRNHKGGGNWLSTIRNEVNYQHTRNLWFPYTGVRSKNIKALYHLIEVIPKNSLSIEFDQNSQDELKRFLTTTVYIIALAKEIMSFMESSSKRDSIHKYGPLQLERLLNKIP